jgi:hypothetical protein
MRLGFLRQKRDLLARLPDLEDFRFLGGGFDSDPVAFLYHQG